jgi:hypothetical protein
MQKDPTRTDQTPPRNDYGTCPSLAGQGMYTNTWYLGEEHLEYMSQEPKGDQGACCHAIPHLRTPLGGEMKPFSSV